MLLGKVYVKDIIAVVLNTLDPAVKTLKQLEMIANESTSYEEFKDRARIVLGDCETKAASDMVASVLDIMQNKASDEEVDLNHWDVNHD